MTFNQRLKKEILPGTLGGIGLLLAVAPAAFALTDTTPPTSPNSLSASSVSTSQINLSWSGSTDDNAVAGYEILRNGMEIGTTQNTSYADTNLKAGTSYSYTIEAYDVAGNRSNPSNSVSATTVGDNTVPSIPTNLSATGVSSSQINLAWNASSDNMGVIGYRVYRNGTEIGTTQNTSYADTGLNASTNYSYTIAAYDAAGNMSSRSQTATATTRPNSSSDTGSNNDATSTISVPPTVSIGVHGNILVHGLKVERVSSNSVTGSVWGITYTVETGSAQILSRSAASSSASSIKVGDVLGVEGSVSPNSPTTIQAQVVRDYSVIPREPNRPTLPGLPLPPIGIGPIHLPNPIPFFGQIRFPF